MAFTSLDFFGFLLISIAIYFLVNQKWKWLVLLVSSIIFIWSYSLQFAIYTVLYSLFNYLIALSINNNINKKLKRFLFQVGIVVNIGMLVFYKYMNFLIENLFNIVGALGFKTAVPVLELLVPLGISFYTFQSIGYLIDVNRGTRQAEKHIGKFVLFITYFPKFISGPVERANNLLPQFNKDHVLDINLFRDGILQALWGFFKTAIVADRLEIIVNGINGNLSEFTGTILLLNFFLQFVFLYFNFSGYTDIVLGVSKLFGINLLINFERPLFATNVSNYWRRWHISLTTWCTEYIFRRIILKRMKWKKWASVYAVFLTFLIIGIWHGANWNFIVLGLLQGIAINYEFFTRKTRLKIGNSVPLWLNRSLSRLVTFIFMSFSLVFFFAKNMGEVWHYLSNLFKGGEVLPIISEMDFTGLDLILVVFGVFLVLFSEYRDENQKPQIKEKILNNNSLFWTVCLGAIVFMVIFGIVSGTGSLYKQF